MAKLWWFVHTLLKYFHVKRARTGAFLISNSDLSPLKAPALVDKDSRQSLVLALLMASRGLGSLFNYPEMLNGGFRTPYDCEATLGLQCYRGVIEEGGELDYCQQVY